MFSVSIAPSTPPLPPRPSQAASGANHLSSLRAKAAHRPSAPPPVPPPTLPPKPGQLQLLSSGNASMASNEPLGQANPSRSSSYVPPDINNRPPMPLPHELAPPPSRPSPPIRIRHPTTHTFLETSGWYKPSVEQVLSDKLHSSLLAFKNLHSGIYVFQCREPPQVAYVGRSKAMRTDLTALIRGLTEKNDTSFNDVEEALRFRYPNAKQWNLRAWEFPASLICLEQAKLIVKLRSLRPCGLNAKLEWFSRQEFDAFCEWYTEHRIGQGSISSRAHNSACSNNTFTN